MDDLIIYTIKKIPQRQTGRLAKSIIEEWVEDISKEMPIV